MKIMTYNILNDHPKFSKNKKKNWRERKPYVFKHIELHQPDLLAIQEGKPNQVAEIQSLFSDYGYYGLNSCGQNGGEEVGIFYNKDIFSLESSDTFWLSKTPDRPSKDWETTHFRICSYVQLKKLASNDSFFLFNTHLSSNSSLSRCEEIKVILLKINEIQSVNPEAHFILTGDLNAHPKTSVYAELMDNSLLQDSYLSTLKHNNNLDYTFTGVDKSWSLNKIILYLFYPRYMRKRIDHIFVSSKLKVLSYEISDWSYDKYFPSDHLPIIVEIEAPSKSEH